MLNRLAESATLIRSRDDKPVRAGIILGSGLGVFAEQLRNKTVIPYGEIPHFHESAVAGHSGNLVLGEVAPGFTVACLQGRFHFYEGHDLEGVVFPTRLLGQLGAEVLVVTNAAGGINPDFAPGTLMMISDHLNMMGANPLRGLNCDELGPRFPDMSEAYPAELRQLLRQTATEQDIPLAEGVYAAMPGPSYETPAEVRMLRTLGADAVGMSTVPEVIVANQMGIKVLGVSCITNAAAGVSTQKLSHNEVMETAEQVREQFVGLLGGFFDKLAALHPVSTTSR